MTLLGFDPLARGYTRANAYWLWQFSDLAYHLPTEIRATAAELGVDDVTYVDGQRTDTQAFVASSPELIVVAFRGTEPEKLIDWMTDLRADFVDDVHGGFRTALDEVWPEIFAAVERAKGPRGSLVDLARAGSTADAGPGLWLTGHSLGGALAVLAAMRLAEDQQPVDGLYTYGQPRVGNRRCARALEALLGERYLRFVNNADIVPRVPLRSMGYAHAGSLRYFDSRGALHDDSNWWERLLDRYRGRVEDLGRLGPDDIKDHFRTSYTKCLQKLRPRQRARRSAAPQRSP